MRSTSTRLFARAVAVGLCLTAVTAAPAEASFIPDPSGDVFNTGTHDLLGTDMTIGPATTTILLRFAAPIAAPSAFAANSVIGFVDLDTLPGAAGDAPWGGPVPGGNNWINFGILNFGVPGPTVALDSEFYIDLGSELFNPGFVELLDTANNVAVGSLAVTFVGTDLTITLPTALLGSLGPNVRYGALIGDFQSANDRAPNGADGLPASIMADVVPAPAGLVLGLLGLPVVGLARRHGRRTPVAA